MPASDASIAALQRRGLGRAGPVELDLQGLRRAITEARVLQIWRGQAAPLEALDAPLVRRRLLTQALETRVVRHELARRRISTTPEALDLAVANAADGRGPAAPRTGPAPTPEALTASIHARYGVEPAVVRRVAQDLLEAPLLVEALLDAEPDEALKARWIDAETQLVVDVVRVPRVPTTAEINAVVRGRAAEIDTWYTAHSNRFNTPQRARVHRFFLKGTSEATREKLASFRDRILAGEPFEALAGEHSDGPQARHGGRVGALSLSKLSEAEGLPAGALTVIRPEPDGLAFYRVDDQYPAVHRPASQITVRREIAATLLREADTLAAARAATAQIRTHLAAELPDLPAGLERLRVKRSRTPRFARAGRQSVPGLGLAPELFKALFTAKPGAVVGPLTVRQDYVVARVVSRTSPDPTQWATARGRWVAQWRTQAQRTALDRWLSERLKDETMWVASDRLSALPRAALLEDRVEQ